MCILVVEDEFLIRDVAQELLEEAGYEVLTAENGVLALKQVDQFPGRFTCLLTDYHMPGGVHGGHIIERMRPLYPVIPMILATAHSHSTTADWRDHHRVHLLVKPYSLEEMVGLVNQLMQ